MPGLTSPLALRSFVTEKASLPPQIRCRGDKARKSKTPSEFADRTITLVQDETYYPDCNNHIPGHICEPDECWPLAPELEQRGEKYAFLAYPGTIVRAALRNYCKYAIQFTLTD